MTIARATALSRVALARAGHSAFSDRLCAVTKETQKALVIILGMIAFGIALLVWANHVRPHGY
jgi:hypothetical protein